MLMSDDVIFEFDGYVKITLYINLVVQTLEVMSLVVFSERYKVVEKVELTRWFVE